MRHHNPCFPQPSTYPTSQRPFKLSFLIAIVLATILSFFLFAKEEACALPSETLSGTCSIQCLNPGPSLDESNVFSVSMPDGQVLIGHCIDRGFPTPNDGEYPFSGTWNGDSYSILIHSEKGINQDPIFHQRVGNFSWSPKGSLEITKVSTQRDISNNNQHYSLQGAVFGIYKDESCTQLLTQLQTNNAGFASYDALKVGDYWVREISPSPGFKLNEQSYPLTVNYQNTAHIRIEEQIQTGRVELKMQSGNPTLSDNNACYSFSGAVYTLYTNETCSSEYAHLTTNSEGTATCENLPLGNYWIKETKTSTGYTLDTQIYPFEILSGQTHVVESKVLPQNNPVDILLCKIDKETLSNSTLGSATLEGAEFDISFYGNYDAAGESLKTWTFKSDKEGHILLNNSYQISGDELYHNSIGNPTLPLGSIKIQETKAPEGYLLNNKALVGTITASGNTESVQSFQQPHISNQVIRGNISFVKVNNSSQQRLSGIPFLLISTSTGEAHVLVTDPNGYVSTESSLNSHAFQTNKNDAAVSKQADGSYVVDESRLDASSGVWFGQSKDKSPTTVMESAGALPYEANSGSYELIELPVTANKGLSLVHLKDIKIYKNDTTVALGTISDHELSAPALISSSETENKENCNHSGLATTDENTTPTGSDSALNKAKAVLEKTGSNILIIVMLIICIFGASIVLKKTSPKHYRSLLRLFPFSTRRKRQIMENILQEE